MKLKVDVPVSHDDDISDDEYNDIIKNLVVILNRDFGIDLRFKPLRFSNVHITADILYEADDEEHERIYYKKEK